MYPKGILPFGYCFSGGFSCRACKDFDGGHTVLFGQLERIVDSDSLPQKKLTGYEYRSAFFCCFTVRCCA